jgi:hypothetical protein
MAVTTTTDNMGLLKYWRGHPVRDTDIAENMDIIDAAFQGVLKVAKGVLASGNADAYAFAWQNPEATGVIVQRVMIDVTTAGGTGSSVLNVGTAANATTTSDNLIDGINLNADALYDNVTDGGTNGKSRQRLDAMAGTTDYVTGQILVANAASLVGKYYIEYVLV